MGCITRWAGTVAMVAAAPLAAQSGTATIAVLPFEDTGSYGQDTQTSEALQLGLPEILGATLAAHPGVRVVDRGTLSQALEQRRLGAGHRVDAGMAGQVAKATGARYGITGSFADFYGKFRINARVVDVQSGQILKVVSNDDPKLQDRAQLAAIVQLVAERIVAAIGLPPYAPAAASSRAAVPSDALTDFSRGLLFERQGDKARAANAYQRALTAAPELPEARDGLQRVRGG